ncbi:hypothetical protein C0991_009560, partial [Blastosporella zonata]
ILEINAGLFPPSTLDAKGEMVSLTEDASTLENLFRYVYPQRHSDVDLLTFEDLYKLAEAAEKYEVYSAISVCKMRLKQLVEQRPAEVLAYAYKHGYPEIVRLAVSPLLDLPLDEVVTILPARLAIPWKSRRNKVNHLTCRPNPNPLTLCPSFPVSPPSLRTMTRFGDFAPLCSSTPSYPWCNLFYRQLQRTSNTTYLLGPSADPKTAGVGVNPTCFIPPTFTTDATAATPHLGNIANIVACGLSFIITLGLVWLAHRRKAAVGRIELRTLLGLYAVTLPLNAITTGAFLQQGSTALVVLTAIHAGFVAAFFWALLANALVATQVVEDGTLSSLVPYYIFSGLIFGLGTYLSLDVALGATTVIGGPSNPPTSLRSISLFVVLSIWPLACVVIYFALMTYIILNVLHETRPLTYYALSGLLFVLSQLAWFLLGKVLCTASNHRVDGSFLATVLETAAIGVLYLAWRSITEESWDDEAYYPAHSS